MGRDNKTSRIDQLLSMAWSTNSPARSVSIARQVLELSPENTDALIIIADNTEDPEERIRILSRAMASLDAEGNCKPEDREILRLTVNERLAYTYFSDGNFSDALSACEEALKIIAASDDPDAQENEQDMKTLYYRLLIELKEWHKILSETMKDEEHYPAWGYSRLVAAWMTAPGRSMAVCANMFWDALMLSPDIPFYMLGYLEEPDDNSDSQEQDDFDFALMYYDVISVSDDLCNWFTRGAILFGLLTNRFDGREREYVLDVLDTLGGYEEYERMSSVVVEGDDRAVIEMLAANKCLSE